MARRATTTTNTGATPSLIRWGAVFGGMVIGLSLLILLTALWLAIGVGTGTDVVMQNMNWFVAGSAIVAMFAGGLLAGWLSGVPGAGPGFFNGLTVWGLILIGSIVIGAPGALQIFGADAAMLEAGMNGQLGIDASTALWAGFVSLLIGALAAGLGGVLGGMTTRPALTYATAEHLGRREEHREIRDERTDARTDDDVRSDRTASATAPEGMTTPTPEDRERTIRMPEEERAGRDRR